MAWACGKKDCWMWPNTDNHICDADEYWPDNVSNDETLESFIKAYATIGFEVTDNGTQEKGYEKIALYVSCKTNTVTHAARLLPNGLWTSKLSFWEDIQHGTPQSLEGDIYGYIKCYMKRLL